MLPQLSALLGEWNTRAFGRSRISSRVFEPVDGLHFPDRLGFPKSGKFPAARNRDIKEMGGQGVLYRAGGKLGAHQASDPRGPLVGPRAPAWLWYIFGRDRNQVLIGVTRQHLLSLAVD